LASLSLQSVIFQIALQSALLIAARIQLSAAVDVDLSLSVVVKVKLKKSDLSRQSIGFTL